MAEHLVWPGGIAGPGLGLVPSLTMRQPLRVSEGALYFNSQPPVSGGKSSGVAGDWHLPGCESACDLRGLKRFWIFRVPLGSAQHLGGGCLGAQPHA